MKSMKRVRANTFYDEDKLGDYVVACNVCGQIAIADNEEELNSVACSECGNIDWSVLPYRKGSPVADDKDDMKDESGAVSGAYGRWKPSKSQAREFAEKMRQIDEFCAENGISQSRSGDSYYFEINGQKYRVSNHAVESRKGKIIGWDDATGAPIREEMPDGWTTRDDDVVYIHAGKTRIMDIYNDLKAGKKLDGNGNPI